MVCASAISAALRGAQPFAERAYPRIDGADARYGWRAGWHPRGGERGVLVHAWTGGAGERGGLGASGGGRGGIFLLVFGFLQRSLIVLLGF